MKDIKIYKSNKAEKGLAFWNEVKALDDWCKANYYKLKCNAEYYYCEPMSEEEKAKKRNAKIVALIREKYTIDEELAILRQRDTKPTEFAEYNAYAEQCKAKVRV